MRIVQERPLLHYDCFVGRASLGALAREVWLAAFYQVIDYSMYTTVHHEGVHQILLYTMM